MTDYIKHPIDPDKKEQERREKRYKRDEDRLLKLFASKKPKGNFIFMMHYTPYGFFDIVKNNKSPMFRKHVGFEPYNKVIKKYKPAIAICGHMHEYQGMKRMGKTTVVATGPAFGGKAAIIDCPDKEGSKIKIRLIR